MNSWEIISLIIKLISRLYPIAKQVYGQVKNPYRQDMTPERALHHIKAIAKERGLNIGDTKAIAMVKVRKNLSRSFQNILSQFLRIFKLKYLKNSIR
jgi:hypothetical protein